MTTKKVLIVTGVILLIGTTAYGMHAGWFKKKPKQSAAIK